MPRARSSTADNGGRYGEHLASIGPLQAGQVLDSASARTGVALTILGESFQRHIRDVLAEHDLKPRQLRILDLLDDRGPVGQRELAELMGIDHSVLVGLLNPLESARLIKRERDSGDRRRHVVTIATADVVCRYDGEASPGGLQGEEGTLAIAHPGASSHLHARGMCGLAGGRSRSCPPTQTGQWWAIAAMSRRSTSAPGGRQRRHVIPSPRPASAA